ncbi:MAG: putative exosortase interaction domain protein [Rhodospirillales bacterium]|nr:putative exosortase interaction domain protein [Rhodospirillales bacterium]
MGFTALTLLASPAFANLLVNSDFEATQYAAGSYQYLNGLVDSWTYAGNSGVLNVQAANRFNDVNPSGYSGNQYGFVQTTGAISQSFTSASGIFSLSFLDAGRVASCCGGNQSFAVLIDSTIFGTFTTTNSGTFTQQMIASLSLSAGTHTLMFEGLDPGGGDVTSYIDRVNLTQVPEPSSIALLGAGLSGIAALRRRRRSQRKP